MEEGGETSLPARGGKRIAIRPRNRSEEHILADVLKR